MSEKWPAYILYIEEGVAGICEGEWVHTVSIDVVPEDLRLEGVYCRINKDGSIDWCREVWTKEEIEEGIRKGEELWRLLHWEDKDDESGDR